MTEGMKEPNQEKIRAFGENEIYKYLGILEVDTNKQVETTEKIQKCISGEREKLLEIKLVCRHLIKGMDTSAILLVRYSEPFLN